MTPKLVEVEWVDSAFNHGWDHIKVKTRSKIATCRTAGYLLKRDKTEVTVAQSLGDEDQAAEAISIPTIAITKFRFLK